MSDVLKVSKPLFRTDIIRTQILAEKPDQLLLAALELFPAEEQQAERRPFLEQALALLEQQAAARTAEDLHVEAMIHAASNHPDKALKIYQRALNEQPNQVEWRWEFAKLLRKQERLREAKLELDTILRYHPRHFPAQELKVIVAGELAKGKR